jgi:hypothetical protein
MNVPVTGDDVDVGMVTRTPPVLSDVRPLMLVGGTKPAVVPGKLEEKLSLMLQSKPTL